MGYRCWPVLPPREHCQRAGTSGSTAALVLLSALGDRTRDVFGGWRLFARQGTSARDNVRWVPAGRAVDAGTWNARHQPDGNKRPLQRLLHGPEHGARQGDSPCARLCSSAGHILGVYTRLLQTSNVASTAVGPLIVGIVHDQCRDYSPLFSRSASSTSQGRAGALFLRAPTRSLRTIWTRQHPVARRGAWKCALHVKLAPNLLPREFTRHCSSCGTTAMFAMRS